VTKALFASLEGSGEEGFGKKKKRSKWKKYSTLGRESFGGSIFLHNTKLSSFGELKSCIGGGFWAV